MESKDGKFDIAGYMEYQGEVFAQRFDSDTYVTITRLMDLWDPARSGPEVYERIQARTSLIGISSDWLFPPADVRKLTQIIREHAGQCEYYEIESDHGHDSFLAEVERVNELLRTTLSQGTKAFIDGEQVAKVSSNLL